MLANGCTASGASGPALPPAAQSCDPTRSRTLRQLHHLRSPPTRTSAEMLYELSGYAKLTDGAGTTPSSPPSAPGHGAVDVNNPGGVAAGQVFDATRSSRACSLHVRGYIQDKCSHRVRMEGPMRSRRFVLLVAAMICSLALVLAAAGCDASSYGDPEPGSPGTSFGAVYR